MIRLRYPFYATLIGLGLWQVVIWITGAPHFILPSPWRVATVGFENRALIAEHALVTGTEVILGLLIGTTLGALTAIQLAASLKLARMMMPLLVFTQAVPVFALAPILTLWFGPVPLSCRSKCSFKPPFVRKRRGFSNPMLSDGGVDCRSR